jgi:hypothetical protein
MADYQLNISHNTNSEIDLNGALSILDNYTRHRVGQPIAIVYTENKERKILFAIGKRNYNEPLNGNNCGREFYEIINNFQENEDPIPPTNISFVFKDGGMYIRYNNADENYDYKVLSAKDIDQKIEDSDFVTAGYLNAWASFEQINK